PVYRALQDAQEGSPLAPRPAQAGGPAQAAARLSQGEGREPLSKAHRRVGHSKVKQGGMGNRKDRGGRVFDFRSRLPSEGLGGGDQRSNTRRIPCSSRFAAHRKRTDKGNKNALNEKHHGWAARAVHRNWKNGETGGRLGRRALWRHDLAGHRWFASRQKGRRFSPADGGVSGEAVLRRADSR